MREMIPGGGQQREESGRARALPSRGWRHSAGRVRRRASIRFSPGFSGSGDGQRGTPSGPSQAHRLVRCTPSGPALGAARAVARQCLGHRRGVLPAAATERLVRKALPQSGSREDGARHYKKSNPSWPRISSSIPVVASNEARISSKRSLGSPERCTRMRFAASS
jgi:hypothetical protein